MGNATNSSILHALRFSFHIRIERFSSLGCRSYGKILHTQNGGLVSVNELGGNDVETFSLSQNYPNPFNPKTKIEFALGEDCFIRIRIYDISGRCVASLIEGYLAEGIHETEFKAQFLPSGAYFYTMEVNNDILFSKRMILKKWC